MKKSLWIAALAALIDRAAKLAWAAAVDWMLSLFWAAESMA